MRIAVGRKCPTNLKNRIGEPQLSLISLLTLFMRFHFCAEVNVAETSYPGGADFTGRGPGAYAVMIWTGTCRTGHVSAKPGVEKGSKTTEYCMRRIRHVEITDVEYQSPGLAKVAFLTLALDRFLSVSLH